MPVELIDVPYAIGDERHPAADGGARLVEAGVVADTVTRIDRGAPFADSASSSAAVNRGLCAAVRSAVDAGRTPIVLAGSCDAALGVLGGLDHSRCGVVWFDAHGDFNTPETTVSGFFPGMSLAIVHGHCYAALWSSIGDSRPLVESRTLLVGVRDLSPAAERERLERSEIDVVEWRDGAATSDVAAAIDALSRTADDVYVHFDLDALDPSVAPGVVDDPVPGGLSLADAEAALERVAALFRIRAAAVTTFNPARDVDDRTLRAALRVVELLGRAAA
jgi:arginase